MVKELTLQQQLDILKKENESLKSGIKHALKLKVSEKGALSVYGLGRFPITLYKSQWVKLLAMVEEIQAFITVNDAALKEKA